MAVFLSPLGVMKVPEPTRSIRLSDAGASSTRMCLTVPAKVVDVHGTKAVVESRGWRREVDASFLTPAVGDYVLIQSGVILQVLEEKEALEALRAWDEVEGKSVA